MLAQRRGFTLTELLVVIVEGAIHETTCHKKSLLKQMIRMLAILGLFLSSTLIASNEAKDSVLFEDTGKSLLVPVRILGRELHVIPDTGSDYNVLDSRWGDFLNEEARAIEVFTPNNSPSQVKAYPTRLKAEIGGVPFDISGLVTADLGKLSQAVGTSVGGILGRSVFTNFALAISFESQRISFKSAAMDSTLGSELPLHFDPRLNEYSFDVEVPNGGSASLAIDTGSTFAVSLKLSDWRRLFPKDPDAHFYQKIANFEGKSEDQMVTRLPRLKVGKNEYRNVLCVRMNSDRMGSVAGLGFLRRHSKVVINYKARRLHLPEPNTFEEELNMSGFDLDWSDLKRPKTTSLRKGGPAEAAGLKEGDVVLTINSVEPAKLKKIDIFNILRLGDGQAVTVGVERAGELKEFRITLKRPI